MKALANEIVKNLVLAGIGSMTILDSEMVVDDDLGSQFFISEQHLGMNVQPSTLLDLLLALTPIPASSGSSATNPKAQSESLTQCRHGKRDAKTS